MRALFTVGAKLIGIHYVLVGLTLMFLVATRSLPGIVGAGVAYQASGQLLAGTLLIYFTDGVARLVRIGAIQEGELKIPSRTALAIGIILIGITEFVSTAPRLLEQFKNTGTQISVVPNMPGFSIEHLIRLLISVGLILGARPLAQFLLRGPSEMFDLRDVPVEERGHQNGIGDHSDSSGDR